MKIKASRQRGNFINLPGLSVNFHETRCSQSSTIYNIPEPGLSDTSNYSLDPLIYIDTRTDKKLKKNECATAVTFGTYEIGMCCNGIVSVTLGI